MITVSIFINGSPIYTRSAVNTDEQDAAGATKYSCDDGSTLVHHRRDGAVILAMKMLETVDEFGVD